MEQGQRALPGPELGQGGASRPSGASRRARAESAGGPEQDGCRSGPHLTVQLEGRVTALPPGSSCQQDSVVVLESLTPNTRPPARTLSSKMRPTSELHNSSQLRASWAETHQSAPRPIAPWQPSSCSWAPGPGTGQAWQMEVAWAPGFPPRLPGQCAGEVPAPGGQLRPWHPAPMPGPGFRRPHWAPAFTT